MKLPTRDKSLKYGRFCYWFLLLSIAPAAIFAQDPAAEPAEAPVDSMLSTIDEAAPTAESDGAIDEVTVFGTPSLMAMQKRIERADETLYGLFNELNNDDKYDVYCRDENRFGSKVKIRVCKANFERGVMIEAYEGALFNDNASTFELPAAELRRHREAMRQEMIRLVVEHPELMTALDTRTALQQAYDAARENRKND